MTTKLRVLLLAVAAAGLTVTAVASAGQAKQGLAVRQARTAAPTRLAGYTSTPELAVQQKSYKPGAATGPGFVFLSAQTNDATAKMTIFSPSGYANVLTQAPGSTVGKAYALVVAGSLGGALLPLSGPVVVGNPTDPALLAAYGQCKSASDPASPQEILVLNTSLQGQAIQVPDFINVAGPYVTQEICLTPPATTPFQAQVVLANFTINGVFTNGTSGQYQWSTDLTPYTGTVPNPSQTVEVRTFVGLPTAFTLKRIKSKPSVVSFSGKLAVSGVTPSGLKLDLYFAKSTKPAADFLNPSLVGLTGKTKKPARTKALKANGSFTITRPKVKKKTYFQARLEDEWALSGGCQGPSPTGLPIPCLEELLSPTNSNQVVVKPPAKKKRHH